MFTKEQIARAYKRLPPETQDLVMSNETADLIERLLSELTTNGELKNLADSEILYAMYCLQSLDMAINNVSKIFSKNVLELSELRSALQDNVFDKYKINIENFIKLSKDSKQIQNTDSVTQPDRRSSSELSPTLDVEIVTKIALPTESQVPTQQIEIHPMIEDGEVAHSVPHLETPVINEQTTIDNAQEMGGNEQKTINNIQSPIEEKKEEPKPTIPHYPGGIDPYREPLV